MGPIQRSGDAIRASRGMQSRMRHLKTTKRINATLSKSMLGVTPSILRVTIYNVEAGRERSRRCMTDFFESFSMRCEVWYD
jgi:hypothetical protein